MRLKEYLSKRREDRIKKRCLKIYNMAKKKRPNKSERDLLKVVLLIKPPFDYQHDKVIDGFLDMCNNISELSNIISDFSKASNNLWKNRERNLKFFNLQERNKTFFEEFWNE